MKTSWVMTASALVMGLAGLAATFLPQEIAQYLGLPNAGVQPLLFQVLGALYLGFAMLNWMARESLIGGIYNRPLAVGNLLHFAAAAMALIKGALWPFAIVYSIFAIAFGMIVFTSPVKPSAEPR